MIIKDEGYEAAPTNEAHSFSRRGSLVLLSAEGEHAEADFITK
ncbi:hypothetical protein [Pauljensenia sp. OF14-1SRA]|nr:hypothetical protein [Pauljensenia sp. OF14-1SRA]